MKKGLCVVAAGLLVLAACGGGDGEKADRAEPQSKETTPDRLLLLEADMALYMRTEASTAQVEAVHDFLRQSSDVRRFVFIDKATAYEQFKRIFRNQPSLVEDVDASALPASFLVIARNCAVRLQLLDQLAVLPGVDEAIRELGLSHAEAEQFSRERLGSGQKDVWELLPPNTRGRCGDQPPTASTAIP